MSLEDAFNPGDRPSQLQLARFHTGELTGVERAGVETWLAAHPEGQELLDAFESARDSLAPFDPAAIRARATEQSAADVPAAAPANNTRFYATLGTLLVAALALFAFLSGGPLDDPGQSPDILIRGDAGITLYQDQGADWSAYTGDAVGEGDTLGITVSPADHDSVVVMSIDGTQTWTVFYPAQGSAPHPLDGQDGRLPDAIVLDNAPGPEVFVAVFGKDVPTARALALDAWRRGGIEGLETLAHERGDVDVVVVQRR